MTDRRWFLTGLEFASLWDDMRESGLPESFVRTCRIADYRQYLRAKRAARYEAVERMGHGFDEFLDVLAKPDIRIIVTGTCVSTRNPSIRLQVVRRGADAYSVEQILTDESTRGGEFYVETHHILDIGDFIAGRLPAEVPRGRLGSIDLSSQLAISMEYDYRESPTREPVYDEFSSQAGRFLRSSVDWVGSIRIVQGLAKYGSGHRAEYVVPWRDLCGDGRYVITYHNGMLTAKGVGSVQLVDVINTGTAAVVGAIREERR
ncbi:ESX secretion-associated protein EspG [Nocardia sp. NPDC051750]|uniref:ESX secretion-associated protein EspG n=1 Tax=Nocardia sp. NPDC051750 TaxID=3364325 RepID=UPI0037AF7E1C